MKPYLTSSLLSLLVATAYASNITTPNTNTNPFNLTDHKGGRWPKIGGGGGGGHSAASSLDIMTSMYILTGITIVFISGINFLLGALPLVLSFFLATAYASTASALVSNVKSTAVDSEKWHCHEGGCHISGGRRLDFVASLFFLTGGVVVLVAGLGR